MNTLKTKSKLRTRLRHAGATLFGAALGFAITASALAADTVTLRVGDQKGGNRSLLEIAGLAKDLPYKIEWSEFPAAAPILEALNAGALDVGYTGDLAFLTVYAAAKIALLAGSIDGWAIWEPYVSYATIKDHARVIADGEGLTPTITFYVASDQAIATKRAAVQDLVQRLNKARLWSRDHVPEYAKAAADLTKLPEDVLLSAYTAQKTSPIVIDGNIVAEVQKASDRATRYGILSKTLDVDKAVDRSFTAASSGSN